LLLLNLEKYVRRMNFLGSKVSYFRVIKAHRLNDVKP
jgi:hypothetical protein